MGAERKLGPWSVPAVGLGCMNLSYAYGEPPSKQQGEAVLQKALDLGVTHFDCAALYGFGRNEELVGPFLKGHRDNIVLVSKGGLRGIDGVRTIDGNPKMLRGDIEDSLRRLQTDVIDLYYLHRYDKVTPIEDSIGQLSRFVDQGKVKAIGLSEVSAPIIRRAHAVHPIAAVQSEYSLWSRNVEIAVLECCRELDISFVAFAPLARGLFSNVDIRPETLPDNDIRRSLPRFQEPHFAVNRQLIPAYRMIAEDAGCTPAQLALAWVLHQGDNLHVIPGTTSAGHLEDDFGAVDIDLAPEIIRRLDVLINQQTVSGPRYVPTTQAEIDTEEFV